MSGLVPVSGIFYFTSFILNASYLLDAYVFVILKRRSLKLQLRNTKQNN
jgi:hypothetical protein